MNSFRTLPLWFALGMVIPPFARAELEGTFTTHGVSAVRANGWAVAMGWQTGYQAWEQDYHASPPLVVVVNDPSGRPVEGARVFRDGGHRRMEYVSTTDYIGYGLVLNSWRTSLVRNRKSRWVTNAGSFAVLAKGWKPAFVGISQAKYPPKDALEGAVPILPVTLQRVTPPDNR